MGVFGYDTVAVRWRSERQFELVDTGPSFPVTYTETRGGVIGHPVERFGAGEFVAGFDGDRSQVEPADDFAGAGVDLEDIVGLPLIGVEVVPSLMIRLVPLVGIPQPSREGNENSLSFLKVVAS